MIFEHTSYRSFLKQHILQGGPDGTPVSLRTLARQLEIMPSQLSRVINGRGSVSLSAAQRICARLGLDPDEAEYFCLLVQLEAQPDPEAKQLLLERINRLAPARRPVHELSVDLFKSIADWQHSAILELANLKAHPMDVGVAAKRLGISRVQAELAIERLERLELLEKQEDGTYRRRKTDFRFVSPEHSGAIKRFYRQMLDKVSEAIETQEPFKERLSGFESIPFSAKAMPEARELIDEFFEKMIALARKHGDEDRVCNLSVHFINLTPEPGVKS